MPKGFKKETGDWKHYSERFGLQKEDEIDLHFGRRELGTSYEDVMADVGKLVERAVANAYGNGRSWIMFIHGWSTSRVGQTTARSVVRGFMRSKAATPYIDRTQCVQHETVFIAKVKSPGSLNIPDFT